MQIDEKPFKGVDALFAELFKLCDPGNPIAFRGHADVAWKLAPSLDRVLPSSIEYSKRLADESCIVNEFRIRTAKFFGQIEKLFLCAPNTPITTTALAVIQHYGAQTRLLDWTYSPFVALYLSAMEYPERDGAVWFFQRKVFDGEVGNLWDTYGCKRPHPGAEIPVDAYAFEPNAPDFFCGIQYPIPFARIAKQNGFFTIAGRLGVDHGERIARLLDLTTERLCKQIIPATSKNQILDRLELMNITAMSIDYPGADIVGSDIAASRRNKVR